MSFSTSLGVVYIYAQPASDPEPVSLRRQNTTLFWVRLPTVGGLLVRIGVSSGVYISFGYATAKLYKNLDYNGSIAMLYHRAQELLGYHFSCLHRCARMMIDVYDLTRRFGKVVVEHLCVAILMHEIDVMSCPDAYDDDFNAVDSVTSITPTPSASAIKIPILTTGTIASCHTEPITTSSPALVPIHSTTVSPPYDAIHSVPILLHYSPQREYHSILVDDEDTARPLLQIVHNSICTWVCLANVLGSFLS